MNVIILKDTVATIDGFRIRRFHAGEVHDLREFVRARLISQGKAVAYKNDTQLELVRASLTPKKEFDAMAYVAEQTRLIKEKTARAYS